MDPVNRFPYQEFSIFNANVVVAMHVATVLLMELYAFHS